MRWIAYITQIVGGACVAAAISKLLDFEPIFDFGYSSSEPAMHYLPLGAIGLSAICAGAIFLAVISYLENQIKKELEREYRQIDEEFEDGMY